jgi:predicted dehydrogenase
MPDPRNISRRSFIRSTAAGTGLALAAPAVGYGRAVGGASPADTVVVAIVGTGGRGSSLARSFAAQTGAEVAYVCDVDARRRSEAGGDVERIQGSGPEAVADFRRALDDADVDGVVVAAPNHWHAPAALLAMDAGKHVYVEKPGSHNAREGELIVAAARRHGKIVQMGNQRRSWPRIVEAVERIHGGVIGPVHYARGWYANTRGSIGHGVPGEAPEWLDYELWQGPAPRRPYRDNMLHYNWHWFWDWGTGEIGNNGIHSLDLCRWALRVDHPTRVTSSGGRYFHVDDQQTPDTHLVTYTFDSGKSITWEGLSCNRRGIDGQTFGASFHGADGTLVIEGLGYRVFDHDGELVETVAGAEGFDIDEDHIANFLEGIRSGAALRAPIAEGQKGTLLCHLGNISQRVGRGLTCEPGTGRIADDPEAMALWGRSYAEGWELTV